MIQQYPNQQTDQSMMGIIFSYLSVLNVHPCLVGRWLYFCMYTDNLHTFIHCHIQFQIQGEDTLAQGLTNFLCCCRGKWSVLECTLLFRSVFCKHLKPICVVRAPTQNKINFHLTKKHYKWAWGGGTSSRGFVGKYISLLCNYRLLLEGLAVLVELLLVDPLQMAGIS